MIFARGLSAAQPNEDTNMRKISVTLAALIIGASAAHAANPQPTWKKITLSTEFFSEGAAFGDFNKDGKMDVVSGPYWYEGPDFQVKHEIYKPHAYKADGEYSDNFFAYTYDFNGDGYSDYLVVGFPGAAARLYMNPGTAGGEWKMTEVFDVVDNESPMFADFYGTGKPMIICNSTSLSASEAPDPKKPNERPGMLGLIEPNWSNPQSTWKFTPISPKNGRFQRFVHGIGFGDVNGDGRMDFLEARGWWEQPKDKGELYTMHPYPFANGGAQMHVYDVDGDGLNDVITSLNAHGYGLAWHQQKKNEKGEITFVRHDILTDKPDLKSDALRFSQLHAVALIDMNGDGLPDIVTGKRWYAHHSHGDNEPTAAPVLYWFELKRDKEKGVEWIPHLIDSDSGVGTQCTVQDINADGTPDIVIGNKKGTFVFLSEKK